MLFIHTSSVSPTLYEVHWAAGPNRAGIVRVTFPSVVDDAKACAEVSVLSHLLARFPGKAGHVVTSQGAMKKLMRGADRNASREIGYLKVMYSALSFSSDKKVPAIIQQIFSRLEECSEIERMDLVWASLGRPRISCSLGEVEVTEHAMSRFHERVAPTGTLSRLQRLLSKDLVPIQHSKARFPGASRGLRAQEHGVYQLAGTDIRVVIAHHANGIRRLTTCYRVLAAS